VREGPHGYIPGGSKGDCQRCGFTCRLNDLREEWSGLHVCDACFDPLPDTFRPPSVTPEGLIRPDASPEMPVVFADPNRGPEDIDGN
jgi:hypothetical protein